MTVLEQVAKWVRMEIPDALFEAWLFAEYDRVEAELGTILTSDLASCIGSVAAMEEMRATLPGQVLLPLPVQLPQMPGRCLCAHMGERAWCLDDGEARDCIEADFVELSSRSGAGMLFLLRCRACATRWCLFGEDDGCYFLRLGEHDTTAIVERDEWPPMFLAWMDWRRANNWARRSYAGAETFRFLSSMRCD